MAHINLKGLGVALVTPFNTDLTIDYRALDNIIEHIINGGCNYIVALGTTAETPTLTADERQQLLCHIKQQTAGRVPLIAGCSSNCTAQLIETLHNIDLTGYSAILSSAPYYNKPTQEGIYRHYAAIAGHSPLPVIIYNVPSRTGVNITAETTLRLAHEFENKIIAIKEASGNIAQVDKIIKQKPEGFDVISGDDGITYPLLMLGATGVISVIGNALPQQFGTMVRLALRGETQQALNIHHTLTELFNLLFIDGNPAGIKSLLHEMGMINNTLRLPLVPVAAATDQKIHQVLKNLSRQTE